MPDYIYLLENRLSPDQRKALRQIGEAARDTGMNVFLVGGAVRDLTSGSSVRDLDVAVQGNALKLKKPLLKMGAVLWGEHEASRTLFLRFPVGVRVEISSTRREEYPKPGKPVYHWDDIHADLRRRDFTANAMALSLNEHSYGLLMDPLNGVADIEMRQLRLVSNYGFLEEPARLLRATRLRSRMGWDLDERSKVRFQTAKDEGVIGSLSTYQKGYELEEIGHEEDGLQILTAMEAEGWMRSLFPAWISSKADARGLQEMHRLHTQLQMQGVNPDISAASIRLLTAKLSSKDLTALKRIFVRPGFVEEWNHLDAAAKEFAKQLTSKEAATPSATWKLFTSADPQAVLWLGLTSKVNPIQARYTNFFTVWPEARQKIPHALMIELRITPELPGYEEMLLQMFFAAIDGKLETEERMRAFLEPYSPPAPPPPVTIRRSRVSRKGEPKGRPPAEIDEDRRELGEETREEVVETAGEPAPVAKGPVAKKEKSAAKPELHVEHATASKAEKPAPEHATNQSKLQRKPKPATMSAKLPSAAKPSQTAQPAKKSAALKVNTPKPAKAASHPGAKPASKPAAKKAHGTVAVKKAPSGKKPAAGKSSKSSRKR